jgi:hypothetical protein
MTQQKTRGSWTWAVAAILSAALNSVWCAPAGAGLLDSPPPLLEGRLGTVVFRMGPVYYEPDRVDTVVTCTNLSLIPVVVGLEIFDELNQLTGRLTPTLVLAGSAVTFETSAAAAVPGAGVVVGLPAVDHGKARISATGTQLNCTGRNRFRRADGVVVEVPLALVKRVARRGL